MDTVYVVDEHFEGAQAGGVLGAYATEEQALDACRLKGYDILKADNVYFKSMANPHEDFLGFELLVYSVPYGKERI